MKIVYVFVLLCATGYSQQIVNGSFNDESGWYIENHEETNSPGFIITNGSAKRIPSVIPGNKNHGLVQRVSGHDTGTKTYQLRFTINHITGSKPKAKIFISGGTFGDGLTGHGQYNDKDAVNGVDMVFGDIYVHSLKKNGEYVINYQATDPVVTFEFASNNKDTSYELDEVSIMTSNSELYTKSVKVDVANETGSEAADLHSVLRSVYH